MALLLGGGVIYFLIDEIPNGTILDGNIEDWEGIPRIELETGNISNSNIALEFIAAQTDSVYLSLLTMTSEPLFYSDNGDLLRIFIDTDNTTETGYFVPGMGADYMIEIYGKKSLDNNNKTFQSSLLYRFDESRDRNDWNAFVPLTNIDIASVEDITECRVPLFDLGIQSTDPIKLGWQTSDGSGLTDLAEIIVGVNTENVFISDVILSFQRDNIMPSSNELMIDGYFEDWSQIQKYQDNDWNEYQEGPETVSNQNVDLSEYASVRRGPETFFYMSVNADILSGITIPHDEPKQKNSFYTPKSNEIDVISPISDNKATEPVLKGEDTV